MVVYKAAKRGSKAEYKHRTMERKNPNTQLRHLACFHSSRNISSIINLLEASRGTENREGLCVYAMHLMELSERSSAILMVHTARRNGLPFWNKGLRSSTNQVVAFEAFRQLSQVSIRPMTSISSLSDMHKDICTTVEQKKAAIIILPFHKHQRLDGSLETTRTDFRGVNLRVLKHATCSVGIFVDRGLGGRAHVSASNVSYTITVFIGGCDDREALAYGSRTVKHPGIRLTVIQFLVGPETQGEMVAVETNGNLSSKLASKDDRILTEFKERHPQDSSITYEEKLVRNVAETIGIIHELNRSNLFLVGCTPESELALALNSSSESPELGPVGCSLTSSVFATATSVLVVQQYYAKQSAACLDELPDGESEIYVIGSFWSRKGRIDTRTINLLTDAKKVVK